VPNSFLVAEAIVSRRLADGQKQPQEMRGFVRGVTTSCDAIYGEP
jgi:hypothetical protein